MVKINIRLLVITGLFLVIAATVYCQEAKVTVRSMENTTVSAAVKKTKSGDETLFNLSLDNQTNGDQHLLSIRLAIIPDKPLQAGTPYMIGADEMQNIDGQMVQAAVGDSSVKAISNMYLLFKRGPADYLLVGMISWNVFLCSLTVDHGTIMIEGDGDRKLIRAGKSLSFEKGVYLQGPSWQGLLDKYADLIAKENPLNIPTKTTWTGWSPWDYYTQHFLAEDVTENIAEMQKLKVKTNIIQIDGGWWKQRGDYFDVRENLPGGIKAMIAGIHKNGYKAGLHFDGFRASAGANIVKQHPEYFIHNETGGLLDAGKDPVTKDPLVIWDYSHPGATDYITRVMKNALENWKVDYFKIDFMRQGLFKGISHLPVTNLERFRMGIRAMQQGMGKSVYFLACSANFGSVIGLAQATRVGGDIQPTYEAVKARAQHTSGSYYLNQKVFVCDPDYLVLRSKEESDDKGSKKPTLNYEEAAMWSNYVSIFGSARFASDNIGLLKPEKKRLIEQSFGLPFFNKTIPLDWWDHYKTPADAPNCYLAKGADGSICLGVFNWSASATISTIEGFKQAATFKVYNADSTINLADGKMTMPLKGTHSVLLKYMGTESFENLAKQLIFKMTAD